MSKKPNPIGVDYESMILNADQENVVERASRVIMKERPSAGDMKNDQVFDCHSFMDFVKTWEIVFPGIGEDVKCNQAFLHSPMWGSVQSLSVLLGGVKFVQDKYGSELPEEARDAFDDFRKLLVHEGTQIGHGKQKFVEEKSEKNQN